MYEKGYLILANKLTIGRTPTVCQVKNDEFLFTNAKLEDNRSEQQL